MRDAAAAIAPAVDIEQLARSIAKEHIALQDCDRKLNETERQAHAVLQKAEGLRERQRRHRVGLGRMLIEAKRGIKHGGWLPYLEKLSITPDSAQRWMGLAGYVERQGKNRTDNDVRNLNDAPTLVDAGIDKRPRKTTPRDEQPDPPRQESQEHGTERPTPEPSIDIDRELSRIQDKLCTAAASMPTSVRKQIAHELRETARIIEEMS